ncbi:MAG: cation diffusion facilitator family transporter [Desulfobacterales bacterium]|jgi:cation diffusion facilitator family transporter|nr:cation diffusion facilitator family transporter [Desulfobacterales bacterium]MDP6684007.1 cation diffusion facilitator family transporter [Desulfobacterales bacterium]MDP6806216.1 cation diffusion facilitator family transporter [Desulfobacterales bacterium]|tara:strand:- start:8525 stop:9430 length:906 start_codon:yes stop_codon:yes gene_type:complete
MKKEKAALLSVVSNTILVVIKLAAGILTESISILSEALHSATDLFASFVAYASIKKATMPADSEHPFGHGKYENLSALAESILIVAAALLIAYEAVKRGFTEEMISFPSLALAVMGISAAVNIVISTYLKRISKETDSIALEADAKHLSADVYSSLGVFAGILLIVITGYHVFDSLAALVVSGLILYEGLSITRKSIHGLLDTVLPEDEVKVIHDVLESYSKDVKDFHELRTRKAGSERHIDLHLTVCSNERIKETHETMDNIEKELSGRLSGCNVIIHPEPCSHLADQCPAGCYWEKTED